MIVIYICLCVLCFILFYSAGFGFLHHHLGVFSVNLVIDKYSYAFLLLLILISSCVLVWSYFYIDAEVSYRRFLSLVFAFLGSILFLVLFGTLYGAMIGWDGLGVTSFLLVIYFNNRKSLGSGILTALTNRLGDCFLLVLLAVHFSHLLNSYVLTVLLLLTSITNSAQFPFSSWLPAAMAAPTPVSALVHSSTLVTAGVYLLIRFNSLGTEWLLVVGSVTITMAGLCACAEIDLNNIVALSTLSQLGVIIVALSVNLNSLCFFHLTTHAMFNALLFISVGIGIHSVYGSQDFRTFSVFCGVSVFPTLSLTVAIISLAGFPFISGFYSNDSILESFYNSGTSFVFQLCFLVGVGLTTVYSVKITHLAFLSSGTGGAADLNGGGTGFVSNLPLLSLMFLSVGAGAVLGSSVCILSPFVCSLDNLIPLVCISSGVFGGLGVSMSNASILSSMWYLTPFVQQFSHTSVSLAQVSDLDRGLYNLSSGGWVSHLFAYFFSDLRWVMWVGIFTWLLILV